MQREGSGEMGASGYDACVEKEKIYIYNDIIKNIYA